LKDYPLTFVDSSLSVSFTELLVLLLPTTVMVGATGFSLRHTLVASIDNYFSSQPNGRVHTRKFVFHEERTFYAAILVLFIVHVAETCFPCDVTT